MVTGSWFCGMHLFQLEEFVDFLAVIGAPAFLCYTLHVAFWQTDTFKACSIMTGFRVTVLRCICGHLFGGYIHMYTE
eukprot:803523-Amphidinium_carterae.1